MLLIASDISLFGSFLTSFSIPLLIFSWYSSGIFLAVFELAGLLPSLSFGIVAGIWMKNKDVKKVWVLASFVLGVLSFIIFIHTNVYLLFILNVISSTVGVITAISYQSLFTKVLKKEDFPWGNSTFSLSVSAIALLSPVPAAYLLNLYVGLPFLVDAFSFFISCIIVYLIPLSSEISIPHEKESFFGSLKSTLNFIKTKNIIKNIFYIFLITSLIGGGLRIVNVSYFSSFSSYYLTFALAMLFSYAGDISIKSAVSIKIIKIKDPYKVVIMSILFYIFSFLLLYAKKDAVIAFAAFFMLGMGNGFISPQRLSVIQSSTPKEHLTEILGLINTAGNVARSLSIVLLGVGVSFLTPRIVYLLMGLFMMGVFLVFWPTTAK